MGSVWNEKCEVWSEKCEMCSVKCANVECETLNPNQPLDNGHGALRLLSPVLHTPLLVFHLLPPWRLVLLEGGVVSEASYPAQALRVWELGRRSWSFLHLSDSFLRESPFKVNAHAHHIVLVARTSLWSNSQW